MVCVFLKTHFLPKKLRMLALKNQGFYHENGGGVWFFLDENVKLFGKWASIWFLTPPTPPPLQIIFSYVIPLHFWYTWAILLSLFRLAVPWCSLKLRRELISSMSSFTRRDSLSRAYTEIGRRGRERRHSGDLSQDKLLS